MLTIRYFPASISNKFLKKYFKFLTVYNLIPFHNMNEVKQIFIQLNFFFIFLMKLRISYTYIKVVCAQVQTTEVKL